MSDPYPCDHRHAAQFGGVMTPQPSWQTSEAVILPVPFERTTSYGQGTRNGPRELIIASAQVELWDEEMAADVHDRGMFTAPELDLTGASMTEAMQQIEAAAGRVLDVKKFLITLGGEHSITPPLVAAAVRQAPGLTVLQIDAHADLRDHYLDEKNSHACAMRRTLEHAPIVQVGVRNISDEEVKALPSLKTRIFYDWNMREDARWMDAVVDSLSNDVYVTIDLDGLDPGVMPAVGTPEPGGLSWRELTGLLRKTFERRNVVACDVVELCPVPGLLSPNFVAARLVYKLLTYKFAATRSS